MGAKWDAQAGSWYVPGGEALEPFNKWQPNNRKYIVCSYSDKDDAKKAGARWDASCKQWYFDANNSKAESKLSKWLPSSKNKDAPKSKPKTKKKPAENTKQTSAKSNKPKALTKSQIATIPRINDDMTIAQLQTECRSRNPSIRGISTKNKSWFLEHLKIGTPWISADAEETIKHEDTAAKKKQPPAAKPSIKKAKYPTIHAEMTVTQLQIECRARDPDIKGLTNKNKTWFLDHLKIGTKWRSAETKESKKKEIPPPANIAKISLAVAKTSKKETTIHADMTIAQLQMECRARDPSITGLSNKNKRWLLDHLKIGSKRAPTIHEGLTVTQLEMECRARDPNIKGLTTKNKIWFLDHLKVGTCWTTSKYPGNSHSAAKGKANVKRESSKDTKPRAKKPKIEPSSKKQESKPTKKAIKRDPDSSPCPSQISSSEVATSSSASKLTRIASKMTTAKLTEEAKARKLCYIPKLKSDLMDLLVEGSICVHQSPEYKAYQNLLERVKNEESALRDAKNERIRKESSYSRINEIRRKTEENMRKIDRIRRKKENSISEHEQAWSNFEEEIDEHDSERRYKHEEQLAREKQEEWMRRSDFGDCEVEEYEYEKRQFTREKQVEHKEAWSDSEEEREQDEHESQFKAEEQFSSKIKVIKGKHLNPKSSGMKYTVWCRDLYRRRYEEESDKEFDSVWATKEDANSRAKYLFYWKNAWGIPPEEIDHDCVEPMVSGNLKGWTVTPDGGSTWTVGVVPSDAFPYLDKASLSRHDHD